MFSNVSTRSFQCFYLGLCMKIYAGKLKNSVNERKNFHFHFNGEQHNKRKKNKIVQYIVSIEWGIFPPDPIDSNNSFPYQWMANVRICSCFAAISTYTQLVLHVRYHHMKSLHCWLISCNYRLKAYLHFSFILWSSTIFQNIHILQITTHLNLMTIIAPPLNVKF